MISIPEFLQEFNSTFPTYSELLPWEITSNIPGIIEGLIPHLSSEYLIKDGVAVHRKAVIESNVIIKAPAIITEGCFIGANAYLRGGIFLGKGAKIGTSCEIKTSLIFNNTGIAHFNFIGDSIIGSNVNFEAGAITANHFNEREEKIIKVYFNSALIETKVEKFGALVGDNSKIGANAVLSPGTILRPNSVVGRLELVDQTK